MTEKQFETMQEDLALIKRAVCGESKTGQVGLVKRVDKIERKWSALNLRLAAVFGGGAVIVFLVELFFKK